MEDNLPTKLWQRRSCRWSADLRKSAEFSLFLCSARSPKPFQLDYISPAKVSGPVRQEKNEKTL
jgi:hypothetical protein